MQSPRSSIAADPRSELSQSHPDQEDAEVPLASFLFTLVGIGYLFPFSALTQPVDYWNLLFPDFNIEFPLTTLYMWTNLIVLGLLVWFTKGQPPFSTRIIGGFIGQFMVLLLVPTSYFWHMSEGSNKFIVLGSAAAAAVVTAFLDSSIIALAAQYPLRVQESLQLGIGVSTLIGSLYRDATKLMIPSIVESSLLYFYAGALTIAVCVASFVALMRLDLSKRCLARGKPSTTLDTLDMSEATTLIAKTSSVPPIDKSKVLKKIWLHELLVGLLFASTLALWPPLVTEIQSFNFPSLQASGWWSLILLTCFSISDCIGRLLVRYRWRWNRTNIGWAVLWRLTLIPLIICSVKGILFTNDLFSIIFVSLLGATNGYVGTLCIVMVNECVCVHEQAVAGTFTSFALNTGLVVGATVGLIAEKVVVG